jgi:hypothetical protein
MEKINSDTIPDMMPLARQLVNRLSDDEKKEFATLIYQGYDLDCIYAILDVISEAIDISDDSQLFKEEPFVTTTKKTHLKLVK